MTDSYQRVAFKGFLKGNGAHARFYFPVGRF